MNKYRNKKIRMQISGDEGKTWKWRWITGVQFDPRLSELNEGEWVKVNENLHKVVVKDGKLTCPPLALVVAMQ